jgi:pyridoxal phosphate enzyme (YggS family)
MTGAVTDSSNSLAARYSHTLERVQRAVIAAKRPVDSVKLIAVSKTQPVDAIALIHSLGQRDFGENYVQEWSDKRAHFASDPSVQWHFIGHLQSNKAKLVAPYVTMVHTVDSAKIAHALERHAAGRATPLAVLIQVNVGSEAQKSGCDPTALSALLDTVESCNCLRLAGLMCIPPVSDNPADSMRYFELLATLRDKHGGARRLPELSMGMTHDLEVAIAAGATLVRVGTALFGERR